MNSSRLLLKREKTKKKKGRIYCVYCSVGPMPKTQTLKRSKMSKPNAHFVEASDI